MTTGHAEKYRPHVKKAMSAAKMRAEAAELEARAFRLGQTIATTQAEQMSLFARAAVLRARAEEA